MAKALYVDGNYILVLDKEQVEVVHAAVNYSPLLCKLDGTSLNPPAIKAVWEALEAVRNSTGSDYQSITLRVKR